MKITKILILALLAALVGSCGIQKQNAMKQADMKIGNELWVDTDKENNKYYFSEDGTFIRYTKINVAPLYSEEYGKYTQKKNMIKCDIKRVGGFLYTLAIEIVALNDDTVKIKYERYPVLYTFKRYMGVSENQLDTMFRQIKIQ